MTTPPAAVELSPSRLEVLRAVAAGRVFWSAVPSGYHSASQLREGRRRTDVTVTTNWLRSHGLIMVSRPTIKRPDRRPFVLTKLGEQALAIADTTGQS